MVGKPSRTPRRGVTWTLEGSLGLALGAAGLATMGVRGLLLGLGAACLAGMLWQLRDACTADGRRLWRDRPLVLFSIGVLVAAVLSTAWPSLTAPPKSSTLSRVAVREVFNELLEDEATIEQAERVHQPLDAQPLLTSAYQRQADRLTADLPVPDERAVYSFYVLANESNADATLLAGRAANTNFSRLKQALEIATRALAQHVS